MSQNENPFIRGYQNLQFLRTLLITYGDDCPPIWRPLHASQADLPDDQVVQFPCVFGSDYALIPAGRDGQQELEVSCQAEGIVRAAVYAVTANELDGQPVHVGDTYSEGHAREVVRRLEFSTGFYSRCWEISTAHITEDSRNYLCQLVDSSTPMGVLFVVFRIPYSPAIGIKLIATPWLDENLMGIEGMTTEQLRQEHLSKGMPEDLVDVLALAGQADVRVLIFDADASELDGLAVYEEGSASANP